jgi:hypothetical protein
MTNNTISELKESAQKAAAEDMGLPRPGYNGMDWGHLMLIELLLGATNGTLHSETWPGEEAEAERKEALRLIVGAGMAFTAFAERYSPIGADEISDPEARESMERATQWAEKVFASLPDTPER